MDLLVNKDNKFYQLTGIIPVNTDYTVSHVIKLRKTDLGTFDDPRDFCGLVDRFNVFGIETTFPDKKVYEISVNRSIIQCNNVVNLIVNMLCFPGIQVKGVYKRNKT